MSQVNTLLNLSSPPQVVVTIYSEVNSARSTISFDPSTHANLQAQLAPFLSAQIRSAKIIVDGRPSTGETWYVGILKQGSQATTTNIRSTPFKRIVAATDEQPVSLALSLPDNHGFGREILLLNLLAPTPVFAVRVTGAPPAPAQNQQPVHLGNFTVELTLDVGGLSPFISVAL